MRVKFKAPHKKIQPCDTEKSTDWGTRRPQRYFLSEVLYSIIVIFHDFVSRCVPNDFISL